MINTDETKRMVTEKTKEILIDIRIQAEVIEAVEQITANI